MNARFLHVADCHLGYKQYSRPERVDDFAMAFGYIIDQAIARKVDFVVLAGDLFQKRAIDALTLQQSMAILERLQRAQIPCIAVEGNHELSYYVDYLGWVQFLQQRKLLRLLDADFQDGQPQLTEHNERKGAFINVNPALRIYGLKYRGSSTGRALTSYAEAIAELHKTDNPAYSIFIAHTGVEGVLPNQTGGLSHRQLAVLRPHVNYLALGHVHKPFEFDDWIYNPGSPENCSMAEAAWPDRGYYLVNVDTDTAPQSTNKKSQKKMAKHKTAKPKESADGDEVTNDAANDDDSEARPCIHTATLHSNPRRPFVRLTIEVDHHTSPEDLTEHCQEVVERKARDHASSRRSETRDPVVELTLAGIIPFDRAALNMKELEEMVRNAFDALHVMIRNQTTSADFAVQHEAGLSRGQLEHQVVGELLARDARYADHNEPWADLIISVKNMALAGADSETILHELSQQIDELDTELDAKIDNAHSESQA